MKKAEFEQAKKQYESPQMDVITFEQLDVLCTSDVNDGANDIFDDEWEEDI